ncbi:PIN-like domain-containing protein [Herpetosiphon geysericola]|uniref:PIN like domain-containing protein n=1 Tax=Herpetosiphon geysericola TaxID=70996 RepID=A0A0N8GRD3_9CHLR|nr:PIN-like domain-containing protein [Herpetosiphon geysericola]KPL86178.1 hypothetical protein SE18_15090 [Herpetosiphon geysericola]
MTMRSLFPSFYSYSDDEIDAVWENCLFIVDTNILRKFFYMTDQTLEKYLKLFEDLNKAGRLWIPHHVALEFSAIHSTMNQNISKKDIQNFINLLEKSKSDIKNKLDELSKRNLKIIKDKTLSSLISNIDKSINDINEFRKNKTHIQRNTNILNKILDIFTNIGGNFSVSDIEPLCREAEGRFTEKIPPGFNDDKKDSIGDFLSFNGKKYPTKYGDFFIWKQILNHVESFHSDIHSIILITDDNKSDWMDEKRARRELVEEVCNKGINYFMIYSFDDFSKSSKKYFDLNIDLSDLQDISTNEKIILDKKQDTAFGRMMEIERRYRNQLTHSPPRKNESPSINSVIDSSLGYIDNEVSILQELTQTHNPVIIDENIHYILNRVNGVLYMMKDLYTIVKDDHNFFNQNINKKISYSLFHTRNKYEISIDYFRNLHNMSDGLEIKLESIRSQFDEVINLYDR